MRRRNTDREALYASPSYRALLGRIGANVRRLRDAKGWTQEECADRCGAMSAPLLRRIELASTNITALTLARLAEGLGVDAAELLAPGTPHTKRRPGRPRRKSEPSEEETPEPTPASKADPENGSAS